MIQSFSEEILELNNSTPHQTVIQAQRTFGEVKVQTFIFFQL